MMIRAWRIARGRHAAAAFSGEGAAAWGGRWNSPGTRAVYTAGSIALAMLEMLVHLQDRELLRHYVVFPVTFDSALVQSANPAMLPRTWRRSPAPPSTRRVGDAWVGEGRSAILRVPSAVVPAEWNYLLNPAHPDFAKITIGPRQRIRLDPRLLRPPAR
jgi:RES domain-containing protein